ncbi:MAG: hypothetical protein FWF40_00930 [Methanomassiliicoccaceae archaeon]|nr:hypothetical protein [Methanomassiliicoccaceae archaeon]
MLTMDSVIKRKSVRKYEITPLSDAVMNELKDFIGSIELPFTGKFECTILTKTEYDKRSGGMFNVSAPYYLMFFGDKEDDNVLRNIGFAGELACLKLADMDIGTCWLGGPKSKETFGDMGYVICICFGIPREEFRKSESEADRKSLNEIAKGYTAEAEDMLKCVRLAPSARNLQPWSFEFEGNKVHVFKVKTGGVMSKLALFKMLQKIDIGIAVSHFSIVKKFTVENAPQDGNGTYECTLKF